jgi:hypothetical protein
VSNRASCEREETSKRERSSRERPLRGDLLARRRRPQEGKVHGRIGGNKEKQDRPVTFSPFSLALVLQSLRVGETTATRRGDCAGDKYEIGTRRGETGRAATWLLQAVRGTRHSVPQDQCGRACAALLSGASGRRRTATDGRTSGSGTAAARSRQIHERASGGRPTNDDDDDDELTAAHAGSHS